MTPAPTEREAVRDALTKLAEQAPHGTWLLGESDHIKLWRDREYPAAAPSDTTPDVGERIDAIMCDLHYDLSGDQMRAMIEVDDEKLRSLLRGAFLHGAVSLPAPHSVPPNTTMGRMEAELAVVKELANDESRLGESASMALWGMVHLAERELQRMREVSQTPLCPVRTAAPHSGTPEKPKHSTVFATDTEILDD